jgi:hypothetical protein
MNLHKKYILRSLIPQDTGPLAANNKGSFFPHEKTSLNLMKPHFSSLNLIVRPGLAGIFPKTLNKSQQISTKVNIPTKTDMGSGPTKTELVAPTSRAKASSRRRKSDEGGSSHIKVNQGERKIFINESAMRHPEFNDAITP